MAKIDTKQIIIIMVVVAVLGTSAFMIYKKRKSTSTTAERFSYRRQDVPTPVQPEEVSRPQGMTPQFDAPITPRFDADGTTQSLLGGAAAMANQAVPATPSPIPPQQPMPDFAQLGGVAAPVSSGAITSKQASEILENRFGTDQPKFIDTVELMPVPDMRYTAGADPTDPQSFMYDRTIFGKLKRRYGNQVDYFRGDLDIKPEYRGYFDIQPPSENDIVKGYFDRYIDIQQETAIRDATFERATPVEQLFKATTNPWGDTSRYPYAHV